VTRSNRPILRAAPAALLLAVLTTAPAFAVGPQQPAPEASLPVAAQPDANPAQGLGYISGIDVSHWQTYIRWRDVARDGIDFAIVKATDGTWMKDLWYDRNKERAEKVGLRFTAYHFARPGREGGNVYIDARREARWFLRHADLGPRNLAPVLDLEVNGGLSPKALKKWTLTWLRFVEEKLGVKPMVYTSPGFWTGHAGNTKRVAEAGFDVLWVAHYGTSRPSVPANRWDGHGWTIWQWTECGRVRGVKGCVDRNYFRGDDVRDLTIKRLSSATPR
jgi:lysozyme